MSGELVKKGVLGLLEGKYDLTITQRSRGFRVLVTNKKGAGFKKEISYIEMETANFDLLLYAIEVCVLNLKDIELEEKGVKS